MDRIRIPKMDHRPRRRWSARPSQTRTDNRRSSLRTFCLPLFLFLCLYYSIKKPLCQEVFETFFIFLFSHFPRGKQFGFNAHVIGIIIFKYPIGKLIEIFFCYEIGGENFAGVDVCDFGFVHFCYLSFLCYLYYIILDDICQVFLIKNFFDFFLKKVLTNTFYYGILITVKRGEHRQEHAKGSRGL